MKFARDKDDVKVALKCQSLEQLYCAASVRLLATVVDDCDNWTERATVVLSGDTWNYWNWFPKPLSEFGESAEVRVRVRWTRVELSPRVDLSPRAVSRLTNGTARVQCRWRLCGLNTVRPTARWWDLWSEPFGSGAVWRMRVRNAAQWQQQTTAGWCGICSTFVKRQQHL